MKKPQPAPKRDSDVPFTNESFFWADSFQLPSEVAQKLHWMLICESDWFDYSSYSFSELTDLKRWEMDMSVY